MCEKGPVLLAMLGCGNDNEKLYPIVEWRLWFCEGTGDLLQSYRNLQVWAVHTSKQMQYLTIYDKHLQHCLYTLIFIFTVYS